MKKILVIEDNFEVRDNLCEILELANYKVVSAENGKIGVQMAKQEKPDLIICDVMMPELDGFGVMKIIQKDPSLNHIPLIFLTAKAEKTDMRRGMGLGADDYIMKPFEDTDLLEAIEIRLSKSERIKQAFDQSEEGLQQFFSEAKAQEEFEKLSLDKEIRSFKTKDQIYTEGQTARWLYFIISGKVKLFQTNEYGKELTTNILNAGEFFGHFSLINQTPYSQSASCFEDTLVRLIPYDDFALLLFNNKDFAAQFIKMIANKTEETERQLIDMAYSSVRKKVANALLAFATSEDKTENRPYYIKVSREELASVAGTAKETLIRTLSDFKEEGLIEVDSKSTKVISPSDIENLTV